MVNHLRVVGCCLQCLCLCVRHGNGGISRGRKGWRERDKEKEIVCLILMQIEERGAMVEEDLEKRWEYGGGGRTE